MRGLEKNNIQKGTSDRQTDRQTDRHRDSMTNSTQRAELVRIVLKNHCYDKSGYGERRKKIEKIDMRRRKLSG